MDWTKVTPDTMPPDMERLMVTMLVDGEKTTIGNVRKRGQVWQIEEFLIHKWLYIKPELITHWMPMPKPAEDCKTEKDCIPTPHLIDATTTQDIISGRYPVYTLGVGVSEDDLTDDEQKLWEQSKRWRAEN